MNEATREQLPLCRSVGGYRSAWVLSVASEIEDASGGFETDVASLYQEVAAVALYGQPFGFTDADVALVDRARLYLASPDDPSVRPDNDALIALSARIASLLPKGE